jgi:ribonuclease P protein component
MTPPKPRAYPPSVRVRRKSEYGRVFAGGIAVRDALLKLLVLRTGHGESRLGTAVSRRFGKSVARNRVRRRIREAFRLHRWELPGGLDIVAIPLERKKEPDFAALERSLVALVRRALSKIEERERAAAAKAPAEKPADAEGPKS